MKYRKTSEQWISCDEGHAAYYISILLSYSRLKLDNNCNKQTKQIHKFPFKSIFINAYGQNKKNKKQIYVSIVFKESKKKKKSSWWK